MPSIQSAQIAQSRSFGRDFPRGHHSSLSPILLPLLLAKQPDITSSTYHDHYNAAIPTPVKGDFTLDPLHPRGRYAQYVLTTPSHAYPH